MGQNFCPACGAPIGADDLNMKEGVGLCRACGKLSRLGPIADAADDAAAMTAQPPKGCRLDDMGNRIVVRASTRSIGGAIGAGLFGLFWNGLVWSFVFAALSGIYVRLVGPLPSWFPTPSGGMPLPMAIAVCVFLIPFVAIGLLMIGICLTCLAGEVRVVIAGPEGMVRTGVGALALTKRFDASAVKRVAMSRTTWKQDDQSKPLIEIEADRKVRFGSVLSEDRLRWMLSVLRTLLLPDGRKRA